jgi:hypothetical protein
MPKKRKPGVIYPYDYVRIINPDIFIRCGYPLNKELVKDTVITKEQREAIDEMLRKFDIGTTHDTLYGLQVKDTSEVFNKVLDVVAGAVLGRMGFGGKERIIYTERRHDYASLMMRVYSKRIVKTGSYYPPSGGHDYWTGEYDYEPGGLADAKTHVILSGVICDDTVAPPEFEIEQRNVHLIEQPMDPFAEQVELH